MSTRVFLSSSASSRTRRGIIGAQWLVSLPQISHRLQVLLLMFHYIFSFMPVNVNTFFVAPWFEAQVLQPTDGSADRGGSGKLWREMRRRKEIVVHPFTKALSSHVGCSFLESMLSHPGCSLMVYLFIVVNATPSILSSLCLL